MAIPKVLANFETSLASKISNTATTLTLVASTNGDGSALSGAYYLTIDEGTSSEEHMIVTLTGASGVIDTRGISRVDAKTLKTANRYSHDRGASVKLTNMALIRVVNRLNGDEAFDSAAWTGVASISGLSTPTAEEETKAANVKYVNDVSIAGANDATETAKGIVEIATEAESLAGTDTGSTSATLVVKPSLIAKNIQNSKFNYAVDTAGTNNYAINLTPAITSYATGLLIIFEANATNSGAATLNVNGLGAKSIVKKLNTALEAGDILDNCHNIVVYNGTAFQLLNQQHNIPSSAILNEMDTFFSNTNITGAEAETLTDGSDANSLHSHVARLQSLFPVAYNSGFDAVSINNTTYTVPTGKMLVVVSYADSSGSSSIQIDNANGDLLTVISASAAINTGSGNFYKFMPLYARSGAEVRVTGGIAFGYLLTNSAKITPVCEQVIQATTTTYTVPAGKILVLTNLYIGNTYNFVSANLGTIVSVGPVNDLGNTASAFYGRGWQNHIVLEAGDVLSTTTSGGTANFNGYLIDIA